MVNFQLKIELLKQGISQVQLAHRLGIDDGYLSNIIHGWKRAPEALKTRIAQLLGKEVGRLFPNTEAEPRGSK